MTKQKYSLLAFFLVGFIILTGLDQWTKALAVLHLKGQSPAVVWENVFEFYYSENRGAAFGMLQEKQLFFFLISVLVLGAIFYMMYRMPAEKKYRLLSICLMFVAAGASGNLIDRITQGYVVDFLYFKLIDFPIFNVADCYVTVAAACLVILMLFYYKDEDMACFYPGRKKEE